MIDVPNKIAPYKEQLPFAGEEYRTEPKEVPFIARIFPTLFFYSRFIGITWRGGGKAKKGQYDDAEWIKSSVEVLRALEQIGVRFEITGLDHLRQLDTPCVVIGNHMSILETLILPGVIRSFQEVTFVIKSSLLEYPVFKHIMRSRDPVSVSRTNPREDLKAVLEGGVDRLKRGVSIIVFPQTTRADSFDPNQFNTIGIKLANRAGVPVIPLALMTDAWGNGRYLKDFGKIDISKTIHFAFGEPIRIQGRGSNEHQLIINFINRKLDAWKDERKKNNRDRYSATL